MQRRLVASTPLALALFALAGAAHAQQAQQRQPGWIGISYEMRSARSPGTSTVVITDVMRGSPAESAGLRAGDRLVAIDDLTGAQELMNLPKRSTLRAGQLVEMRIERDGRQMELRLRAAERSTAAYADAAVNLSFQTDSMVETMFRAMDSLRVHLLETSDRADARAVALRAPSPQPSPLTRAREAVSAPFEFFVFRGEQHDSLVREMAELNRAIERLRERETERLQELRRERRSQRAQAQDRGLADVRGAIEELTRQSATLRAAMAEAARASAGWEYLLPASPDATPEPPEQRADTFRPLTPYLLGSNLVAGAQVIEVQPELGAYFGVDSGVLVVEVSPGTPAALSGMRPGDVVTRLDRVGVRTVEDFRFGVAQAGDTLPVTLVRHGQSVQVLLRRR